MYCIFNTNRADAALGAGALLAMKKSTKDIVLKPMDSDGFKNYLKNDFENDCKNNQCILIIGFNTDDRCSKIITKMVKKYDNTYVDNAKNKTPNTSIYMYSKTYSGKLCPYIDNSTLSACCAVLEFVLCDDDLIESEYDRFENCPVYKALSSDDSKRSIAAYINMCIKWNEIRNKMCCENDIRNAVTELYNTMVEKSRYSSPIINQELIEFEYITAKAYPTKLRYLSDDNIRKYITPIEILTSLNWNTYLVATDPSTDSVIIAIPDNESFAIDNIVKGRLFGKNYTKSYDIGRDITYYVVPFNKLKTNGNRDTICSNIHMYNYSEFSRLYLE